MSSEDEPPNPAAMSHEWLAAMGRIAAGRWAWSTVDDLVAAGHPSELLDELITDGWLVPWKPGETAMVTFTPWAADRLGIAIVEQGEADRPRWGKGDGHDPDCSLPGWEKLPELPSKCVCGRMNGETAILREFPDPAPGPVAQAEEAEEREKVAMMREEVMTYDESKDEWTVDVVETPLVLFGQAEIKVERRIKGKR
jgi:hypothetical protein